MTYREIVRFVYIFERFFSFEWQRLSTNVINFLTLSMLFFNCCCMIIRRRICETDYVICGIFREIALYEEGNIVNFKNNIL